MQKKDFKFILKLAVLWAFLCSLGCATTRQPIAPNEYLYTTKLSTSALFDLVAAELEAQKYKSKKRDVSAGVYIFYPRSFTFKDDNGEKVRGRQALTLRQEGGSIRVRLVYNCKKPKELKSSPCYSGDNATKDSIARANRAILNLIEPVFKMTPEDIVVDDIEID